MTRKKTARKGPGFYLTKKEIMQMYGRESTTVKGWIRGIERQMETGRYGRYAVLDSSSQKHVNEYVLIDYLKHQKELEELSPKDVPPFDPEEIARICPIETVVILEADI